MADAEDPNKDGNGIEMQDFDSTVQEIPHEHRVPVREINETEHENQNKIFEYASEQPDPDPSAEYSAFVPSRGDFPTGITYPTNLTHATAEGLKNNTAKASVAQLQSMGNISTSISHV